MYTVWKEQHFDKTLHQHKNSFHILLGVTVSVLYYLLREVLVRLLYRRLRHSPDEPVDPARAAEDVNVEEHVAELVGAVGTAQSVHLYEEIAMKM